MFGGSRMLLIPFGEFLVQEKCLQCMGIHLAEIEDSDLDQVIPLRAQRAVELILPLHPLHPLSVGNFLAWSSRQCRGWRVAGVQNFSFPMHRESHLPFA